MAAWMKSANWISATGRIPRMARPTEMPAIAVSAIGMSTTRSGPKRSSRPSVARKTPPRRPMSSPRTRTVGSRSISSRSASRTASRTDSSRIGVLGDGGRVCLWLPLAPFRRFGGDRHRLLVHGVGGGGVETRPQQHERVAPARLLDLVAAAVAAVVVVRGIGQEAVAAGVDQGRSLAGARALDGARGRLVHRLDVHAVDRLTGHPVAGGAGDEVGPRRLQARRHRLRVAVVLDAED